MDVAEAEAEVEEDGRDVVAEEQEDVVVEEEDVVEEQVVGGPF